MFPVSYRADRSARCEYRRQLPPLNSSSQISNAGTNGNSNLRSNRNLYTLSDQILITRGIHTIDAGVWFQQLQSNDNLAANQYEAGRLLEPPELHRRNGLHLHRDSRPRRLSLFIRSRATWYAEDIMKLRLECRTANWLSRRIH